MKFIFSSKFKAIIVTVLLSLAGLYLSFGVVFHRLDNVYFNGSEDGIKNYYTLQYHILYDSSYNHFQGMNYPYGEHITFTDNQPALSNTLRFIHHKLFDISGSIILIINLFMLGAVIFCAILLCLIMMHYGVGWWYAALAATAVSFLSPQIARFADSGHYALSYSFYIPLLWYLWLKFLDRKTYLLSILICIVIIIVSLLHLYYLPIGILFGLFIWFFAFFHKLIKPKDFAHLIIQVVLPLLLIQLWLKLTDNIMDRPSNPAGFLIYRAYWEGIFLPYKRFFIGGFINEHITPIRFLEFENRCYVGITSTLFMLLLVTVFIVKVIRRQWGRLQPAPFAPTLNVSFWAACAVTIFALGFPFIIKGFEYLVQYIGPLKQFRGIGRFAWVFFYILNALAFISIYRYAKRLKNNNSHVALRMVLLGLPLLIILYDIYEFHLTFQTGIRTYNYSPEEKKIPGPDNYQAIIPIPYFHIGSENLFADFRCESLKHSAEVSLSTGLAMTGVAMSRNSIGHTLKQMPVHYPEYRPLQLINDFKSQKPFLLVVAADCELSGQHKRLISRAEFISRDKYSMYYSLPYSVLQDYGHNMLSKIQDSIKGDIKANKNEKYYYNSFNNNKETGYKQGGLKSEPGKDIILYEGNFPADSTATAGKYLISFWVYIGKNPYGLSNMQINELSSSGERVSDVNNVFNAMIKQFDGEWAMLEQEIEVKDPANHFQVILYNSELKKESLFADELLIRPLGTNITFPLENKGVYFNNLFFY